MIYQIKACWYCGHRPDSTTNLKYCIKCGKARREVYSKEEEEKHETTI